MAYFTGTANNPADLLLKIKSHATSIGWITDRSTADEWCCHNADGFWSIKVISSSYMRLCGNTGFNNAAAWDNQPGNSIAHAAVTSSTKYASACRMETGPYIAYHLFATIDYLHCAVEIASGQFRHLHIGSLDKRGAVYDGGQYVCGTYKHPSYNGIGDSYLMLPYDSHAFHYYHEASRVRVDAQDGAPSPDWLFFTEHSSSSISRRAIGLGRGYARNHPSSLLVETSANHLTGGTLLIPCTIYTVGAENRTRMIGEVPDFRVCRMDYLSPGDTVIVGSETWRVFPPIERTASDDRGSGMVGYAYKVVA